ncbi:hypothetical protein Srubr_54970 [Streptomyces rubradiris]|uniref:SseB protein N-terminal domain-containing protein n=2 Tax=Streptomyces rubradiris TaxID=285531 RepID=A0ABQ3RIG0_STRRR|nr:hypothetical protein GCM10018792_56910 [Streptomyces rubradiris]GHI55651.1 hypothetical protein Srubr_54970 [Streptomyces rubradiris]
MIPVMSEHGGETVSAEHARRSRLYDYLDPPGPGRPEQAEGAARGKREFAVLLGEFRRTAVLVPVDEDGAPLTADFGGVRWFYAFSDEGALARFALARGEGAREWVFQRWLGARLLDAAVPAVGVPCGVALDCADGEGGMLFPPVRGVVPDAVAVDVDGGTGDVR